MWVEVAGLPGVGKTSLIRGSIEEIKSEYLVVQSTLPSIKERIAARYYRHVVFNKSNNHEQWSQKLSYRQSFRVFKNKKQKIFFYDSGIIQLLIENLIETDFANVDDKISDLKRLNLPNALILVEDEIKQIISREISRSPRRFKLDRDETARLYEQASDFLKNKLPVLFPDIKILYVHAGDTKNFLKAIKI